MTSKLNKISPTPTILLIEDDDFLLTMYKMKLELENFKVITATNGENGLRMIREKKPDLILLDLVLPKMSGFEIMKELKKDKELWKIPVIMLTNLSQKDDVQKGFNLGAQEYLIKVHFLPSEVISKIRKILEK